VAKNKLNAIKSIILFMHNANKEIIKSQHGEC